MKKQIFFSTLIFTTTLFSCTSQFSNSLSKEETEKELSIKFTNNISNFKSWVFNGPDIMIFAKMYIDSSDIVSFFDKIKEDKSFVEYTENSMITFYPPEEIAQWFDLKYIKPDKREYLIYTFKVKGSSKTFFYYFVIKSNGNKSKCLYIKYFSI